MKKNELKYSILLSVLAVLVGLIFFVYQDVFSLSKENGTTPVSKFKSENLIVEREPHKEIKLQSGDKESLTRRAVKPNANEKIELQSDVKKSLASNAVKPMSRENIGLQSNAKESFVYKTPSGKKYHTAVCRYVKNVSHKVSLAEAEALGLSACSQCNPDRQESRQQTSLPLGIKNGEAKGNKAAAVRCQGTTKAGMRCKRTTKNVNGYCFQHEQ